MDSRNSTRITKKAPENDLNDSTLRRLRRVLSTCPSEDTFSENPTKMLVDLFPHQKSALSWLLWREKQTPSGGLLADEMGLGKTLTMISLIVENPRRKAVRKDNNGLYPGGNLIICPTSLMNQWANEIEKRTKKGVLSVEIYHGQDRETDTKKLKAHDVVITTYGTVRSEYSNDGIIYEVNWRRIILDEAHQIRNQDTQICNAVCSLWGKSRWALTGTPIHNSESDMYSILKFLQFEPFDDFQVWQQWFNDDDPGSQGRLKVLVRSFMLRRSRDELMAKGMINDLPVKNDNLVALNLEEKEMDIYQEIFKTSQTKVSLYVEQQDTKSQSQVKNKINLHCILVLLLRLRQLCCHPSLIKEALLEIDNDDIFSENYRSTKIKKLIELLKVKTSGGDKAVVVSQWTSFLQIIGSHLEEEQIKFTTLNGSIAADERMPLVDDINNPKSKTKVLLLSLTAGGVGLNLMGANHLFLLDLHWNPQLENQAQDRIYRIGQQKPVFVYKFLTVGTVEEKIKLLQDEKMGMAKDILEGSKNRDNLSLRDLKLLFKLQCSLSE